MSKNQYTKERQKMKIKFTIPGKLKRKQQPRICRIDSRNVTYTPKQTTEYEKSVRASYTEVSKMFFDKNILFEISIISLFSIPCGQVVHKTYLKKKQNIPREKLN